MGSDAASSRSTSQHIVAILRLVSYTAQRSELRLALEPLRYQNCCTTTATSRTVSCCLAGRDRTWGRRSVASASAPALPCSAASKASETSCKSILSDSPRAASARADDCASHRRAHLQVAHVQQLSAFRQAPDRSIQDTKLVFAPLLVHLVPLPPLSRRSRTWLLARLHAAHPAGRVRNRYMFETV